VTPTPHTPRPETRPGAERPASPADGAIPVALDELLDATGAAAAELFLADSAEGRIWMAGHRGASPRAFRDRIEFGPGEGLPGTVIASGRPLAVKELDSEPRFLRNRVPGSGIHSYLCAPVRGEHRVLGSLNIASRNGGEAFAGHLPLLAEAAEGLGRWLDLARLRTREELAEVLVSDPALGPKRNLELKTDRGLDAMVKLAEADGGIVLLHSTSAGSLAPWAWSGTYRRARGTLARRGRSCACPMLAGKSAPGESVHTVDCPHCEILPAEIANAICLPLRAAGEVVGAVSVGWHSRTVLPGRYLSELEGAAEQMGLAIADEQAAVIAEERATDTRRQRLLDEIDLIAERSLTPIMLRIERAGTRADIPSGLRTELHSIQGLLRASAREIAAATRDAGSSPAASVPDPEPGRVPLLDLHCFGHFTVFRGGQPVPAEHFSRRHALLLLKILLTNYGRPVHREVLADLIWGAELPRDPARQLKVVVHYLRRALDPGGTEDNYESCVTSTEEGYAFNTAVPHRLDYQDFLSLVHWADRLEERGEPEAALGTWEAAISLYRGDFLEEERYTDWCEPEREHLREAWLSALWRAAALRRDRGDADGALAFHRQALATDPAREDIHREMMRILDQEDRRGDALRQYRLCCEALKRAIGAEPSAETRDLYLRLASPRPA